MPAKNKTKEKIIEILKRSSKEFWEKHWTNPEYEHNSYLADQILSLLQSKQLELLEEIEKRMPKELKVEIDKIVKGEIKGVATWNSLLAQIHQILSQLKSAIKRENLWKK